MSHLATWLISLNLLLAFSRTLSDDNILRKRSKRQFYGGHSFGMISVPFFTYGWGNNYDRWYGPGYHGYGWGGPFGPGFGYRRRVWRRRWFFDDFNGPWHN
uniref:Glycine-rich protein n=1 Tax=Setaria digitata TaxID=48799 RepID=A0A915Q4T0_9BILA